MLKVFAIQDKEQQRALCALCGVEYDVELLAYEAEVEQFHKDKDRLGIRYNVWTSNFQNR